ncbi:TolC family protein [Rhodocaloribacter litoris]|uniref:TolC family protein n=1 Tax=Rhodocaloribacter litoris TaxID=2558931 RepID=UPI001423D605|nr:TolC family protein [Rhodocaloribacter litoris]QXD13811.1 TolC family protein [Rhodocaloribacter litoris]
MLLLALLFAGPVHVRAQVPDTVRVHDLPTLLAVVRAENPALRAARLQAEALGTRRDQVAALPDPMVMFTYQPFPVLTARGTQRTQLRLEQSIPFPGKLGLGGEVAGLGAEVAGYEADALAQDLAFQVKEAYYELYRLQRQEALLRAFQDRLRDYEAVAATRYAVGEGMQQAILKAQLERNTLDQRLLDLARQRRTALEALSRLLDRPVALDTLPALSLPALPSLPDETLVQVARRARPEAAALDADLERARAEIALARRDFLPDFGLSLTYFDIAAADMPPTATGRDALALGVSVKVPLQRGRLRARLEEARLRQHRVEARREALEASFRTTIADLRSRLERERDQLDLYRDVLLPQAEATLEATLSAYTTGRTGFLDLLDAERVLFTLQTGYEDAYARYLQAAAALERALGLDRLADLDESLFR